MTTQRHRVQTRNEALEEYLLERFTRLVKFTRADARVSKQLQSRARILRRLGIANLFFLLIGALQQSARLLVLSLMALKIAAQFERCNAKYFQHSIATCLVVVFDLLLRQAPQ